MRFESDEFYLKSREEMEQLFPYAPEAIDNTVKIAQMCNVEFDFIQYIFLNMMYQKDILQIPI